MDTRRKILTPEAACNLDQPLVLVTGCFDILRAEHVRELTRIRETLPGRQLAALVLPCPSAVLSQRARAELVAALRVIDYVLIAENIDFETLIENLKPVKRVHFEKVDADLARQLKDHVLNRQVR